MRYEDRKGKGKKEYLPHRKVALPGLYAVQACRN